ncbi:hypothetical protein XENOCAPTIV_021531, partial [Xenoophorus captivus]
FIAVGLWIFSDLQVQFRPSAALPGLQGPGVPAPLNASSGARFRRLQIFCSFRPKQFFSQPPAVSDPNQEETINLNMKLEEKPSFIGPSTETLPRETN